MTSPFPSLGVGGGARRPIGAIPFHRGKSRADRLFRRQTEPPG
jgi:hypothetical protein